MRNLKALSFLLAIAFVFFPNKKIFSFENNNPGIWVSFSDFVQEAVVNPSTGATTRNAVDFTLINHSVLDNIDLDLALYNEKAGGYRRKDVTIRGSIYLPKSGDYFFRAEYTSGCFRSRMHLIPEGGSISSSPSLSITGTVPRYLNEGWYQIYMSIQSYDYSYVPYFRLYWTVPGESEEIIPKEHFNHKFWSDKKLIIPASGKSKVNYSMAGIGTAGSASADVEVSVPDISKVMDDEIWIFWEAKNKDLLRVKNKQTGVERSIASSENLRNEVGLRTYYLGNVGKIPPSVLSGNPNNQIQLEFSGFDADSLGLGIIVPYEDETQPQGNLSFYLSDAMIFKTVSPTMVFSFDSEIEEINPTFFISETLTNTNDESNHRPNYLVMKKGVGPKPNYKSFLPALGGQIIFPTGYSSPFTFSKANGSSWYPGYGRSGRYFDVLSSLFEPTFLGYMEPVNVSGQEWVAFQLISSNLPGQTNLGNPESMSISGGGLFSNKKIDHNTLKVNIVGEGSVRISGGGTTQVCSSPTCDFEFETGTSVMADNFLPNVNFLFDRVEGACSSIDTCSSILMDEDKTITVVFAPQGCIATRCAPSCSEVCLGESCLDECQNPSATCKGTKQCNKDWMEVQP